ncbi:unnamed protein product, partial [Urochloa humidicola]
AQKQTSEAPDASCSEAHLPVAHRGTIGRQALLLRPGAYRREELSADLPLERCSPADCSKARRPPLPCCSGRV